MQTTLNHYASPRFWECYAGLPHSVKKLADANFELLQKNPRHPSLHFKQIGVFWSVRVGLSCRALGVIRTQWDCLVLDRLPHRL
jgi:hypothetical protein